MCILSCTAPENKEAEQTKQTSELGFRFTGLTTPSLACIELSLKQVGKLNVTADNRQLVEPVQVRRTQQLNLPERVPKIVINTTTNVISLGISQSVKRKTVYLRRVL
jgi:hypothetical protein